MGMSRRLSEALDAVGARLKREKKHLVYELPNGRTFVASKSPSDQRAEQNALSDLRAVSGAESPKPRKATRDVRAERRRRPGRAGESPPTWGLPAENASMASAFRQSGLIEQQLRVRVGQLESDLMLRELRIAMLESLWVVRAWMAVRRVLGVGER